MTSVLEAQTGFSNFCLRNCVPRASCCCEMPWKCLQVMRRGTAPGNVTGKQSNESCSACILTTADGCALPPQGELAQVRELANVDLGFLGNRLRSAARTGSKPEKERICLRFFAALVLLDLISEVRGGPAATLQHCWPAPQADRSTAHCAVIRAS